MVRDGPAGLLTMRFFIACVPPSPAIHRRFEPCGGVEFRRHRGFGCNLLARARITRHARFALCCQESAKAHKPHLLAAFQLRRHNVEKGLHRRACFSLCEIGAFRNRRHELERALRSLEKGDDARKVLERLSEALTNKLLHGPTHALNTASDEERDQQRRHADALSRARGRWGEQHDRAGSAGRMTAS